MVALTPVTCVFGEISRFMSKGSASAISLARASCSFEKVFASSIRFETTRSSPSAYVY